MLTCCPRKVTKLIFPNSMYEIQVSSTTIEERAQYSALALERATINCFSAHHEIQFESRKVQ